MKKIFEQYGGVITTTMAIVALIGVVALLFTGNGNGWMEKAFNGVTENFSNKVSLAIDGLGGAGGAQGGPTMLDGDGQTVNQKLMAAPLQFRSSADVSTLQNVTVDGTVVDASNYTVTEGSTIITFTHDYVQSLSAGDHTVAIVSEGGTAEASFKVESNNVIPEGATYTQHVNGRFDSGEPVCDEIVTYNAGDNFPTNIYSGDEYSYGDYTYIYIDLEAGDKWSVFITDQYKSEYGVILESINGQPTTNMSSTFYDCPNLTVAPAIPKNITNMSNTFYSCSSLIVAPEIPEGVTNMMYAFAYCTQLTEKPTIPSTVTTAESVIFQDCPQFGY